MCGMGSNPTRWNLIEASRKAVTVWLKERGYLDHPQVPIPDQDDYDNEIIAIVVGECMRLLLGDAEEVPSDPEADGGPLGG